MLINVHETSTGVCHDMSMVGEFCRQEGLVLVADAISSFLADPYYMNEWNIDVSILSSQKAPLFLLVSRCWSLVNQQFRGFGAIVCDRLF